MRGLYIHIASNRSLHGRFLEIVFPSDDAGKEIYFERRNNLQRVFGEKFYETGIEQHFIDQPLAKLNVLFSFMTNTRGASIYKIIYTVVLVNLLLTRIAAFKPPFLRFFECVSSSLCQFYSVLSAKVMVFLGRSTFFPFFTFVFRFFDNIRYIISIGFMRFYSTMKMKELIFV